MVALKGYGGVTHGIQSQHNHGKSTEARFD